MHYGIIAAGEGSRLVSEGVSLPKPLVRLNGVPMIKRLIDIFMQSSPESLSVIVNEQMTEVREFLRGLDLPVPLNLVVKTTPSSMHSFYEVSKVIPEGKFCLTTVDTIFREDDFRKYIDAFIADDKAEGYMAVTPFIDDEKPLYVATDKELRITGFLDTPADGVRYVSGGIYGLTPKAVDVLDRCMADGVARMRNYQRRLVEAGLDLRAYVIDKIIDVDHAGDIATAQEFIK
ncbi:MAG: NDP-sugar synthase [Duncaniella sp.]|nr:NDP-sugar synthase [Duncaniella sp.]